MKLVSTWKDIEDNLLQLEKYRHSSDSNEVEFYVNLIKRGICFVVLERDGELIFGPSRFVGYVNNNMSLHASNPHKDGRETNPEISRILGEEPAEYDYLETEYINLCGRIGVTASATGPFNIKRKYWLVRPTK